MEVPLIVHITWHSADIPRILGRCLESFKRLNPTWKIMFWTDERCEEFVKNSFSVYFKRYMSFKPGVLRADFFRLLVLAEFGGVYVDIDMECIQPLDNLLLPYKSLDYEVIITTDHPIHEELFYNFRTIFMNNFIISVPKAQFILKLIDEILLIEPFSLNVEDAVDATGPGLFTRVLNRVALPECLLVHVISWKHINPIPDLIVLTEELIGKKRLEFWERSLETRSWLLEANPFMVHYWHHTYAPNRFTLTQYKRFLTPLLPYSCQHIFQSQLRSHGNRDDVRIIQMLNKVIVKFADDPEGHCVMLKMRPDDKSLDILSFITGCLDALSFPVEHIILSTHGSTWRPDIRDTLILINLLEAVDEELMVKVLESLLANERTCVFYGKLDKVRGIVTALASREELSIVIIGDIIVLRVSFKISRIPPVLHTIGYVLTEGRRNQIIDSLPITWKIRVWNQHELDILLQEAGFVGRIDGNATRRLQELARYLVISHEGGISISPKFSISWEKLSVAIWNQECVASFKRIGGGGGSEDFGKDMLASSPNHPFWFDFELDLHNSIRRNRGEDIFDGSILWKRAKASKQFWSDDKTLNFIDVNEICEAEPQKIQLF